jgi:hypothetical protein
MLKCLSDRYPLLWVKRKQTLHEVEELGPQRVDRLDRFLEGEDDRRRGVRLNTENSGGRVPRVRPTRNGTMLLTNFLLFLVVFAFG